MTEKKYEELSSEFAELNQEYNRAVEAGELTDELELKFMRAERELRAAYEELSQAKITEGKE